MGWLEYILLGAVALWLGVTVFCLRRTKTKRCAGCCAGCSRRCGQKNDTQ